MALARFAEIAHLLREYPLTLQQTVREQLFARPGDSLAPSTARTSATLDSLAPMLAWILEHTAEPKAGHHPAFSSDVASRLRTMGEDQRRFGYPPEGYRSLARALRAGLRDVVTEAGQEYSLAVARAEELVEAACATLARAAIADAAAGVPAAYLGTVVDIARPGRSVAVVTLETGLPIQFQPGDRLPVTCPATSGAWVPLAPSAPADEVPQTQFHLDLSAGTPTEAFVACNPGDQWTLGRAHGRLRIDPGARRVVMIAHKTGWSALRALLLDMLSRDEQPEVLVFLHADDPADLYEAAQLQALAKATSWLHVVTSASQAGGVAGVAAVPEPVELAEQLLKDSGGLDGCHVLVSGVGESARQSGQRATEAGAAEVMVEDFGPLLNWD